MKNKDNVQFIKEENNLLQEKFLFTREMYQETIEDKNLYKKQILGSKDSFGKIFDITRKLDVIQPHRDGRRTTENGRGSKKRGRDS